VWQSLCGNLTSNWIGLAQFYLMTISSNAFRTLFEDPNRSLDIKFIVPAFLFDRFVGKSRLAHIQVVFQRIMCLEGIFVLASIKNSKLKQKYLNI
jgi:hypothetical protein